MATTVSEHGGGRKAPDPEALATLRARFKSALALDRTTAKKWCLENGVSEQHLYAVLKGTRESETLLGKLDKYVADVFARHPQPSTAA